MGSMDMDHNNREIVNLEPEGIPAFPAPQAGLTSTFSLTALEQLIESVTGGQSTIDFSHTDPLPEHTLYNNVTPIEQDGPVDITQYADKRLQHAVMRMKLKRLAAQGINAKQAAQQLGWSPSTVREVYNDPAFRRDVQSYMASAFEDVDTKYEEAQKSVHERIAEEGLNAFMYVTQVLKGQHEDQASVGQKLSIAKDLMDRSFDTGKKTVTAKASFEPEELQRAARAAEEMDNAHRRKLSLVREKTA